MFAYFIKKICSMQINNAGISGVVIDDTDLITTVIKNRGVSILVVFRNLVNTSGKLQHPCSHTLFWVMGKARCELS